MTEGKQDGQEHGQEARGGMLHMTEDLIPKFDGQDATYTTSRWIQDINDNGDIFNWTETQKLLVARRSLIGTAALWLRAEKTFKTWEELRVAILKEFTDTVDIKSIHELMTARKKRADESCIDYMFTMKELGKRGKMADYVAIKYIIDGIQDNEINKVMLYGVTTYSDLKEKLKVYETMKGKMSKEARGMQQQQMKKHVRAEVRCYSCGERNHVSEECPRRQHGKKCFHCNKFGHISPECPGKTFRASMPPQIPQPPKRPETVPPPNVTVGPIQGKEKPSTSNSKFSPNYGNTGQWQQKRTLFATTQDGAASKQRCSNDDCKFCSLAKDVLVTGDSDLLYQQGRDSDDSDDSDDSGECDVLGVNKLSDSCVKTVKPVKEVKLCGKSTSALVDSGSDVNLVSANYFLTIDLPQGKVNKGITLTGLGRAKVASMGQFSTSIEIDGYVYDDVKFYIIPKDCIPFNVILGHDFLCKVVTVMKGGSVWMKPDSWLNKVRCFPCSVDSVGHVMDKAVRDEVVKLVDNYHPCQTKEAPIELKITLKDDLPIAQRPRRISAAEQEEVDHQIKEWLEEGVIRVSFSEYASPLVLVRKKDGRLRICVDYRLINRKMLRDEYPLPIIDDHIDKLANARVFSVIDLKNGFFHLRVHEESIKYTSFVTMSGQYEFLRAPFGLATCPKVFTRYITIIFRDLITRGVVIIFIDDILIPAINEEQAAGRLREVLQTASEYGLQINWTKSQLLVRRVEYLGHVIEGGVVMPSPGKTDAVLKFPEPRNEKQLHSFLGLCSYFRKFIQDYAMLAQPLTDLLRKDMTFEFNNRHRAVFNTLKEKLASSPVLKIYEPRADTELHTDASNVAYAAILMQQDCDGELHPIHYMSRRTTNAESRYTSYELEALAVIEGIKKFRHYLYGKHFKIVTDCKAFQMTLNKKDLALSTKVARWVLFLQDYDFTIEHREGSRMRHADALSRNPYVAAIFSDLHSDVRHAQETDSGLKAIMKILEDGKSYNDFYLQGGLLYKGAEHRVVIPQKMEGEIIAKAHGNGHFAVKKTTELISKDYYISKLSRKVEDFIATCIPCLLASRKSGKQEGFLNPIEKGETPLHTLHLDHIGPLTETRKQYNHILTLVDAFSKFVWLFPTKSTTTQEVLNKLEIHQQTFGNPARIITDRGAAFTSNSFVQYCEQEEIEHVKITTGVPRGNGQVERVHRTIISVLAKLSLEEPTQWYKLVSRVQRALNSTHQRSINTTPFELLIGTKMKMKDDIGILDLLKQEEIDSFVQGREELREKAKKQILEIQDENRKNYDRKRKEGRKYKEGSLVAIKRTQFGACLKLKPKFLGPYTVTKVKRNNRYEVEKADPQTEGPHKTTTSSDFMKPWPDYASSSD